MSARDVERAVAEDALGVGEVADDLDRVPLLGRLAPARLLRREAVQVRRGLDHLALEPAQDVAVGHEVDVVEVVRQALRRVRATGSRIGLGHVASPPGRSGRT